ncbi:MAG: SGNH/GDSL hydrolase family protein [Pseudorhodoplanes sp.]
MKVNLSPFCRPAALVVAALAAVLSPASVSAQTPSAAVRTHPCGAPADIARLDQPLTRTARRVAAGLPLKIVALGSSSTAGAGASTPAHSYPSRLAVELQQFFPGHDIAVLNRGVNGEEAPEMLARLDAAVLSEKPDLILWQVGTNAVLRDNPLGQAGDLIRQGLTRMKQSGADVVLIDPQFAPKVIAKPEADSMVKLIAISAKAANADVFHRYAVMRYWRETAAIPFETFISPDELHMNDWSYACVAKLLAGSIADAATRSTVTATAIAR